MPAPEETALTLCRRDMLRELARLLDCYGSDIRRAILGRSLLCSSRRDRRTTIYSYSGDISIVNSLLSNKEQVRVVGIPVAATTRHGLAPTLGMLSLIASLHLKPEKHYVVVAEPGATLFLYGRDVFKESVKELHVNPACDAPPLIVLDEEHLPLGLGAVTRKRSQFLIRNVLDAGWYLRSGV